MTLKERVIVEVYTGICMTSSEERGEVYKYIREIMDRPVFSHELADAAIQEQLKAKSKEDFINLCRVPKTNADRIRAMNDEELAEFLVDVETHGYHDQSVSGTLEMIEWLQSEAE